MIDVPVMVSSCTHSVDHGTMRALIATESGGNPFSLAAVGMNIIDQPKSKEGAKAYFNNLISQGYNVSVGLGMINMHNFAGLGLDIDKALDPCENLKASEKVLSDCYGRALKKYSDEQKALKAAFSCYYSNNFSRGFVPDDSRGHSYVDRIAINNNKINKIPAIKFSSGNDENIVNEINQNTKEDEINALEKIEDENNSSEDNWDVFNEFSY